jgi:hypothetical protein
MVSISKGVAALVLSATAATAAIGGSIVTTSEAQAKPTTVEASVKETTAVVQTVKSTPVQTVKVLPLARIEQDGRYYYIWLNRSETAGVANSSQAASTVANAIPQPYKTVLRAYLWLMASKAREYNNQGKCMLISVGPKFGPWVNPIPAFTSYTGGDCR